MSKTLEVRRIIDDLTETINDIDPVIGVNVVEAGEKIIEIVKSLETKLKIIRRVVNTYDFNEKKSINENN